MRRSLRDLGLDRAVVVGCFGVGLLSWALSLTGPCLVVIVSFPFLDFVEMLARSSSWSRSEVLKIWLRWRRGRPPPLVSERGEGVATGVVSCISTSGMECWAVGGKVSAMVPGLR